MMSALRESTAGTPVYIRALDAIEAYPRTDF